MNRPPSGGPAGFPIGINPQALQAAFGQVQQQQQGMAVGPSGSPLQSAAAHPMRGMATSPSLNPALLQSQQQQQQQHHQQQQPQQSAHGSPAGVGVGSTTGMGGVMQSGMNGGSQMSPQQQQAQQTGNGAFSAPGVPNVFPAGFSPQNAMSMMQALRQGMVNLQTQWATLSSQPDGPAKQQEQARVGGEMKKLKTMYDQVTQTMRQQTQSRPQNGQTNTMSTDAQQQQAPPPQNAPQQQQQHHNQTAAAVQQASHHQGNAPQSGASQGMSPQAGGGTAAYMQHGQTPSVQMASANSAEASQSAEQRFAAENPQHQAQLAVLQAFAQQQQRQQQQSSQQRGPALPSTPSQGLNQLPQGGPIQHATSMQGTPGPTGASQRATPQLSQQQQPVQGPAASGFPPGLSNLSHFVSMINMFMTQKGTPLPPGLPMTFTGLPNASNTAGETRSIELNALFASVVGLGGSAKLSAASAPAAMPVQPYAAAQGLTGWMILANKLGLAVANPDPNGEGRRDQLPTPAQTPERLRNFFRERLGPFEEWWTNKNRQQQQTMQPQTNVQQSSQMQQTGAAGQGNQQPTSAHNVQVPAALSPVQVAGAPTAQPTPGQSQAQPQQNTYGQATPIGHAASSNSSQSSQTQPSMMNSQMDVLGNQQQQAYSQGTPQQPPPTAASSAPQQPPLTSHQQQALQQLAHQLQRLVQEGKLNAEEARSRFFQAQASFKAQSASATSAATVSTNGSVGQPQANIEGSGTQIAASPAPAVPPSPATNGASDVKSGSGSTANRKRAKKSGTASQPASRPPAASKSGAATPKIAKKELATPADARSSSVAGAGTGAMALEPLDAGRPPMDTPLTPRRAVRLLQQGNLNPAQQAAALAAARSGGATTKDNVATDVAKAEEAPEPTHAPNKFKVEYLPACREMATHGGWDLDLVEKEIGPLTKGFGKQPRSVRELGVVDIPALTMSLRSRLETEMTYALNSLLILSSGSGIRPDIFHVSLSHCGSLLDEMLDVLEQHAFDRDAAQSTPSKRPSFDLQAKSTHADWVSESLLAEQEAQSFKRRRHQTVGRSLSAPLRPLDEAGNDGSAAGGTLCEPSSAAALDGDLYVAALRDERTRKRRADVALTIIDILRNFASMAENLDLLARKKRLVVLLGRLVDRAYTSTMVFVESELLRLRKDVLFIVSSITGQNLRLESLPTATSASLFDLFWSFISDAAGIQDLAGLLFDYPAPPPGVPPHLTPRQAPVPWAPRVPHYADLALDGFARFAQPDANRKVLSQLIPEETLTELATVLVRMLPCSELDFSLFRTEARLSYTEHVAMCLYDVVFLSSARCKLRLRNKHAWVSAVFRVIKRTSKQGNGNSSVPNGLGKASFTQNPFSCLIYRLVETLKLVDDARDMFQQHPMMTFSADAADTERPSNGDLDSSVETTQHKLRASRKKAPLLAAEEVEVFNILATPGLDPLLISHLGSMIAA